MTEQETKAFLEKLNERISQFRMFVQNDGGDIEFKEYKDGILTLEVLGHCVGCASFDMTFTNDIKPTLMNEFPNEIKDVIFIPKKTVW